MNKKKLTVLIPLLLSAGAFAKSPTTSWDSDLVKNYMNEKRGSTITTLTDVDSGSRWYYDGYVKSGYQTSINDDSFEKFYVKYRNRTRGYTALTEEVGFVGDIVFNAFEDWVKRDGEIKNKYDGLDDRQNLSSFRLGLEHKKYGMLIYGKYTATMSLFSTDSGEWGLNNTQGDAGGFNANKIIYDSHFDNNLYVYTSYDIDSGIMGMDIGYQTADVYSYIPDSYGMYLSVHNGQPMLSIGNKAIIGNRTTNSGDNSDTGLERTDENLLTYTLSGYKQFGFNDRVQANISYSEMANNENADIIKSNEYATQGLGLSGTLTYSVFPKNGKGLSPTVVLNSHEFDTSGEVQINYFFNPKARVWLSQLVSENGSDIFTIAGQFDF